MPKPDSLGPTVPASQPAQPHSITKSEIGHYAVASTIHIDHLETFTIRNSLTHLIDDLLITSRSPSWGIACGEQTAGYRDGYISAKRNASTFGVSNVHYCHPSRRWHEGCVAYYPPISSNVADLVSFVKRFWTQLRLSSFFKLRCVSLESLACFFGRLLAPETMEINPIRACRRTDTRSRESRRSSFPLRDPSFRSSTGTDYATHIALGDRCVPSAGRRYAERTGERGRH